MTPGQLTALFRYFQMLIWPLMGAGFMVNMIQRGAVSLGRINEVMNTKPLILSPQTPQTPPLNANPLIEFRDLSFSYSENETAAARADVLQKISVTVEPGTWLGILGRTGSGKTTLIKTLTRMIEPPPGTVFVKGVDVREWDLHELRGFFGVTPQDSYLFSDSIRQNIVYGLDEETSGSVSKKVENAARIAAIDKDLSLFTDGLDTVIGERGLTLSGGQKQRVSLSRALIKDCGILALDDSFSAVDTETEQKILTRLLEARCAATTPQTIIIISHRVSTLRNADKVLVLEDGRVAEYGAPDELARAGGFYQRTAELQRLEQGGESS
jgi:ATP-binding cassette subfamily B protein